MRSLFLVLAISLIAVLGYKDLEFTDPITTVASIDKADTVWLLVSTALVMLMTPGLALFYGGMVRRKNVLGTIMQSFMILCLVSIVWVLWGYSLSFGKDHYGVIGGFDMIGLKGVLGTTLGNVPHLIFMMFQGMFAVITPALITGAFAERMKFSAALLFSLLWVTLVYAPVCHWVWGGGWIMTHIGALDFAGGTVVHINSAVAAFVSAIIIGKRKGYLSEPIIPHNMPMTILGAALLWFGWFGFNAGSALEANELAALAFVNTNTAAAAAALGWSVSEIIHLGRPTALGAVSGAVAGLVAVTPAAGFVTPTSSIIIGIVAGGLCYMAVLLRYKFKYDDSLDVLAIHGVGGIWGSIATGIFATIAVNPAGANGLLHGNLSLVGLQTIAVLATVIYSAVVSTVVLKLVDKSIGLRIDDESEQLGLDISQHNEVGYDHA